MAPILPPDIPLYFIRHGETDWNAARRYQGQTDIPLNDRGRGQAARNGRRLAEVLGRAAGFDFVASPLSRAAETMRIVRREMGLEADAFRREPRLMEIQFGNWEGQTWADLAGHDPEGFAAWKADSWGWGPAGGESYEVLSRRVAGWLAEVRQPTIVAAHGGVSRVLRGLVLGNLSGRQITGLEVPQDQVLSIEGGRLSWI